MFKVLYKLIILLVILSLTGRSQTNDYLGILFDNSGSMKKFSDNQISDAKNLIFDLLFKGDYDTTKWDIIGEKSNIKNLWSPNTVLYLHPFGGVNKQYQPFFNMSPDINSFNNQDETKKFIQNQLFNKLSFSDPSTDIDLAKYYYWDRISTSLNSIQKLKVFIISDFIPDASQNFPTQPKANFIKCNGTEQSLVRFSLKGQVKPSLLVEGTLLYSLNLPTYATNFNNSITITKPKNNSGINKNENLIITWNAKGKFIKYILRFEQCRPLKRIIETELNPKLVSFSINSTILKRTDEKNQYQISITGINSDNSTTRSNTVSISISSASFPFGIVLIIILIIILLIIAYRFMPDIRKWIENKFKGNTTNSALSENENKNKY